jgi:hypothetical protein
MSPPVEERLKYEWYLKRMQDNIAIKAYLIEKIIKHQPDYSNAECLMFLTNEDLLEQAIACTNPNLTVVLGKGQDFDNGFDAKLRTVRPNNYGKAYSAAIQLANKAGILALVYERILNEFYCFAFPVMHLREASIPFHPETGEPKRRTRDGNNYMWEQFECKSFEEMANKSFAEVILNEA